MLPTLAPRTRSGVLGARPEGRTRRGPTIPLSPPDVSTRAQGNALRAAFFLGYFFIGGFGAYGTLYVQQLGHGPSRVAALMASLPAMAALAPPIWGAIADWSGRTVGVLRASHVLSALCFAPLLWVDGFEALLVALAVFGFMRAAWVPILDTMALDEAHSGGKAYGLVRLWGSAGFIVGALGTGLFVERMGLGVVPAVCLVGLVLTAASAFTIRPRRVMATGSFLRDLGKLMRQRRLLGFLTVTFIVRTPMGGLFTFLPPLILENGGTPAFVSFVMTAGVVAEILFFLVSPRLLPRLRPGRWLLASFLADALRWGLIGLVASPWAALCAMPLHALAFSAGHVSSVLIVRGVAPESLRTSAQGLFIATAYGTAMVVGNLAAGPLVEWLGMRGLFLSAAACAALASLAAAPFLERFDAAPSGD